MRFARLAPLILLLGACATPEPAVTPKAEPPKEAPVKKGGEVSHVESQIEVSCEAIDLPEFIEVDLANAEIGTIIHLSDLKAPKGVEFVALAHGDDKAVANVHAPRVSAEAAEEGAAE